MVTNTKKNGYGHEYLEKGIWSRIPRKRDMVTNTKKKGYGHEYQEKGIWSRIPRKDRKCSCGNFVRDEKHVLLDCEKIATQTSFLEIFNERNGTQQK